METERKQIILQEIKKIKNIHFKNGYRHGFENEATKVRQLNFDKNFKSSYDDGQKRAKSDYGYSGRISELLSSGAMPPEPRN